MGERSVEHLNALSTIIRTVALAKCHNCLTASVCVEVRCFDLLTFSNVSGVPCDLLQNTKNRQETFCYSIFDLSADNQGSVQWQYTMHHWKAHDLSFQAMP